MQNDKYTDSQIIKDIEMGDDTSNEMAIRYLYKKYFPMVLSFVRQNHGESSEAEDVFHETLIVFYECIKFKKFRNESSISTYLFSITRNIWLNRIRKSKYIINKEEMSDIADDILEDKIAKDELTNKVITQMLESLGEACRTIIRWYYFENKTMKQIMEKMGYSNIESTKSQKYKCMQKLIVYINENPKYKEILSQSI